MAARRVLLAGAGKREKFDAAELRKLVGAAVRHLKSKSVKRIALALEGALPTREYAAAAVEGAILGEFEPDRYKTGDDKKSRGGIRRGGAGRRGRTRSRRRRAGASWPKRRTSPARWSTSRPTC